MAVIKLGGGVTDMRGSIGGNTFSRGPAGPYVRQRVKPINPSTNNQVGVRGLTSLLSQYWGSTLTPGEREGWRQFAAGTNYSNRVGDTVQVSGLSCFFACNALGQRGGVALITTAPTVGGHATNPAYAMTASKETQQLSLPEPAAGFDKDLDNDLLVLRQFRTMGPGRVSSPQGGILLTNIIGNELTPPDFPMLLNSQYPFGVGDHVYVSAVHVDPYGKVSAGSPYLITAVA